MKQSQVIQEWQNEARKEGREEGRIVASRANLLRVMRNRFSTSLPGDLVSAVSSLMDIHSLDVWLDAASTADTIADFRTMISR